MDSENKRAPGERGAEETARSDDGRNPTTTTTGRHESRLTPVSALLARLSAEFPVIREFRPLVLKLDLATCYAARDASDKQRRRALALHCATQRYLESVAAGGPRYGLDGSICGEVTKLQREAAKARLVAIAKAALRKAARLAKQRRRE